MIYDVTTAAVTCYLLLVAFACQHDELHGFRDVGLGLPDALLPSSSLLQLALQLQRNRHVQLVHLHRLAATLLQGQNTHTGQGKFLLTYDSKHNAVHCVCGFSYLQVLQHHLIQSLDEVLVLGAGHVLQSTAADRNLLHTQTAN